MLQEIGRRDGADGMSERVYEVEDDGDDARELEQPQSAVQVDEPDDDEPTAADLFDEGGVVTAGLPVAPPGAGRRGRGPALPAARSAECRC